MMYVNRNAAKAYGLANLKPIRTRNVSITIEINMRQYIRSILRLETLSGTRH